MEYQVCMGIFTFFQVENKQHKSFQMAKYYGTVDLILEYGLLMPTMAILLAITVAKIRSHRKTIVVVANYSNARQSVSQISALKVEGKAAPSQQDDSLSKVERRLTLLAIYLVLVYTLLVHCYLFRIVGVPIVSVSSY